MAIESVITTTYHGNRVMARQLRKSKIVVLNGPDAGKEFELSKPKVTGGRSIINDIQLTDTTVSGTHFEIFSEDEGYRLLDLKSTNGTFLGDLKIREIYLLPGTKFRVGNIELAFQPLKEVVEIALSNEDKFDQVVGSSVRMREIFAVLEKVSPSDLTVLLTGETGTGKELVAQGIHNMSARADNPFIVLDCGTIPKNLIESTLFGHEKGAFTGAVGQHKGCFEQAHGGTIFLDEIGELDIMLQPKLLRVLENRELKRVGGGKTIKIDVRVVAATNRDLRQMVNQGTFREDLYYRLSVVLVENPPLRERKEDIPQLVHHFIKLVSRKRKMNIKIEKECMTSLMGHDWPGNVRELRNVIERAASLCEGDTITQEDLVFSKGINSIIVPPLPPIESRSESGMHGALIHGGVTFKDAKQQVLQEFEQLYLRELLSRNNNNITRSAQEAGLTRYHLRELIKRYNISSKV